VRVFCEIQNEETTIHQIILSTDKWSGKWFMHYINVFVCIYYILKIKLISHMLKEGGRSECDGCQEPSRTIKMALRTTGGTSVALSPQVNYTD
jgi:hypothetical protein